MVSILSMLGVVAMANVGLLAPVDPPINPNQAPQSATHQGAKAREFKGQLSPNGAFQVHLTLLPPPVDNESDIKTSGRQYIANNSEEQNDGGLIRVQPLQPPSINPSLIPVLVGNPGQTSEDVHNSSKLPTRSGFQRRYVADNHENQFNDESSRSKPVALHLVESPQGSVPAGSGFQGQYAIGGLHKAATSRLVDTPNGPVPIGSGLEGQYVADNLEKRFDDGSDKTGIVAPRIVNTPYGPAAAGSGLEGQHVPDNLEKLYDDGSDKTPEALKGQYAPDNIEKLYDDGSDKTPDALKGLYTPDNIEKLYDDGLDKATKTQPNSHNSVYGGEIGGPTFERQHIPGDIEKRFDYGLYRPKGNEKLFDDGLYRPDELNRRFDDGLIKF